MIRDLISISLQSARNRKLRSWLTIIGIVIGISAIIGLVTVRQPDKNLIKTVGRLKWRIKMH